MSHSTCTVNTGVFGIVDGKNVVKPGFDNTVGGDLQVFRYGVG